MAAAAVDNHNAASSCQDDPNFATICSFIDKFGESCNLGDLPFDYLQEMLENSNEIPPKLAQIHIQLLRRVYKTVAIDKWEKQLAKFGHSYNSQDGWEIERFGYKKAKIQTKLRLLKTLLEAQFDYNVKFKNEVNKLPAEDLRRQPIGRDSEGQLYWYQVDPDANLRIYREDIDDETWEIVASTREEMVKLIEELSNGVVKKNSVLEEENGDGELSPKEILLDTGKVIDDQNIDDEDDNEDEDDEDAMQIDESYGTSKEDKTEPESKLEVVKELPDVSQSDDVKVVLDVTSQDTGPLEPSNTKCEKSPDEVVSSCEISQSSSNVTPEVKQETQLPLELTNPAGVPSEQIPHRVNNGTDAPNGNSDHLVQSESFNLNVHKDATSVPLQTASVSNPKEPVFIPPISKATCQDPLNNDIWNPAVHSSKLYVDNQKRSSATEPNSNSKHQQQQRHSAVQQPANFKCEPSPLDNLKMFTQKMSAKPNTLSENLRKLTAELPDEMDEVGFHPKEADNGEKFVKPEPSMSSSRRTDHAKSRTLESTKMSHPSKKKSKEVPIAQTQREQVSVPSSEGLGNLRLSQQVEKNASAKDYITESNLHPKVAIELCTPVTEETDHKVLPCQAPESLPDNTDQKSSEALRVAHKVSVDDMDGLRTTAEDLQTKSTTESTTSNETSENNDKISSRTISLSCEQPAGTTPVAEYVIPLGNERTTNIDSGSAKLEIGRSAAFEKESSVLSASDLAKSCSEPEHEPVVSAQVKDIETSAPDTEIGSAEHGCSKEKSKSEEGDIDKSGVPSSIERTAMEKEEIPENITAHGSNPTTGVQNEIDAENTVKGSLAVQEETKILPTPEPDNKPAQETLRPVCENSGREESADEVGSSKISKEVVEPLITKSTAWLVGYEDSSNDEAANDETTVKKETNCPSVLEASSDIISNQSEEIPRSLDILVEDSVAKRKIDPALGIDTCSPEKKSKIDDSTISSESLNPIIGEAIEEETMIITGEGSGAELQGGNKRRSSEVSVSDEQQLPEGDSKKSKKAGRRVKSEGAQKKTPAPRRKSFGNELNDLTPTERSVTELNGSSERPMRQSRRIAQLREKEEAERRRQEEEHLAQLKQAQMQKQQKQQELDAKRKRKSDGKEKTSTKSKGKQTSKPRTQEYLPSPSVSASESDNEESYELPKGKGKHGRRRGKKNEEQKFKKGLKPWLHSSSDEDDEAVEEEEEEVHEEEEEIRFDKSDHEFSPESDLGEDDEVCPSRHARTAKIGPDAEDKYATTVCDKCTKGDHPEWILLCDACDKGLHASCLRPQLWVIPEGEWFCPPCQHKKLVEKLGESLIEFDKILKKRENDDLRRQRLTYVGISMENILPPDKTKEAKESKLRSNKHGRRRILSDEEDSENLNEFINDNDSDGSSGSKLVSSEESDDEPMYKLRVRRATKAFNFKEYDDMINSALKDEDEDYDEANDKEEGIVEKVDSQVAEDGRISPPKTVDEKETEETVPPENDEEEIDEKERKYQELEKASQRKSRRRLNDLDATSDDDSDEDFKDSNGDDDEDEEEIPEDDSDWSGDRDADESDESIGRLRRQAKKERKYGRRETYLEVGSVRRSTRRVKPKYQYDESDQEDDDNDAPEPWEENSEESETNSESDDETWGKKKNKKKAVPPPRSSRSVMRNFVLPQSSKPKSAPKKKKKKPAGSDDEDRPWNRGGGKAKKAAEESSQQRTTRGKKINFKDILDSGESDDDGNIRPKRRRVVAPGSDDSEGPSSSKKLMAELNNAKSLAAATEKEGQEQTKETNDKTASALQTMLTTEPQLPANGAGNNGPMGIPVVPEISKLTVEADSKPIPAPPYPPVRNQLREVLKNSEASSKPLVSQPSSTSLLMSEILATPPIRTPSPSKKSAPSPMGPPITLPSGALPVSVPQPIHRGMSPQHVPISMPSEISRAMDPSFMQRAQAMRAFHPAWTRSPMPPPPYGNHAVSRPSPSSPTSSVGKPPPLNSLPFMSQSSMRSPYATPSLGIPSPNPPPLQSFHQFKRDVGLPMYRLPSNLPGLPPRSAGLLPQMHPGLGHPNPHLEQFYGAHGPPFPIPGYGIPPHSQSQPMFSPPQHYDYRGDGSFKNEIMGPGGHGIAPPGSGQMKDDINPGQPGESEFGGLVSYFSSQRGDDDLDT